MKQSWFFKKMNKIDKSLARFTKKSREKTQINKIKNEREVTTDIKEKQKVINNIIKGYTPSNWTT